MIFKFLFNIYNIENNNKVIFSDNFFIICFINIKKKK